MKFGGTSVGNAERMQRVAHIIADNQKSADIVVVTSAMSQATDLLVCAAQSAAQKNRGQLDECMDRLRKLHQTAIIDLHLSTAAQATLYRSIQKQLDHAEKLLESVYELGELSARGQDLITSFGERLSVRLLAHALRQHGVDAKPLEADKLILTTDQFGSARPLLDESAHHAGPRLRRLLKARTVPVVTGFMGATQKGVVTTLGRGGSDYSATILGYCLDADEVWIWTDVDGVMTADPRIVPTARTVDSLTYNEAAELSYFGAKVLHPLTMVPAAQKHIPIIIKNTFHPDSLGTLISQRVTATQHPVKAISSMKRLAIVTVQGKGLLGVHGIAGKVFSALAERDITVLFISQASSDYNLSFVVNSQDSVAASHALHRAFRYELTDKQIEAVKTENNLAIIAIVGNGMRGLPGVAGKLFSVLGTHKVNIVAIAQGSSERNISFVVSEDDVPAAVKHVHDAFELANGHKEPS